MTFPDRPSSLGLPHATLQDRSTNSSAGTVIRKRLWLWHDLPQNDLQDRRVNYLIAKSDKVVKMQIDSEAADRTRL